MAIIITYSSNASALCGKRLAGGGLVAFPTETVYGLGANALNPDAVRQIFAAKGRPSTDPLIVHVAHAAQVQPLVNLTSGEQILFNILVKAFWPGPLTVVVPSSGKIPLEVTAGKNSVGLRMPANDVALELLRNAGVPVAAPSANRFGHVSPTTAQHVFDDLSHADIEILDGGSCVVGIESTVLKICDDKNVVLLRRGAVSPEQIVEAMQKQGLCVQLTEFQRADKSTAIAQDAPGQLLTHYAPRLPAFLLDKNHDVKLELTSHFTHPKEFIFNAAEIKKSVVIDFSGNLKKLRDKVLAYADLSSTGSADEAAAKVFEKLRWAEHVENAESIFLPDLSEEKNPMLLAVFDRLYRAASGKKAFII